ncbi:hypothetical protein ACQ4M3_08960 [Leptolyngbya sp. AN03gr2]|uniref:hypothetical protein n=1 Tax=unclassified Leptolyngbya TaxID=2650499 RepID=UPI003D3118CD
MLQPYISKLAIAILAVNLALLNTGCVNSSARKSAEKESTSQANVNTAVPKQATAEPSPTSSNAPRADSNKAETYQEALDKAHSAKTISQSAQSKDDLDLSADRWQQAIKLMKQVSTSSPNYKDAKLKIAEYQTNLAAVKTRAGIVANSKAEIPTVIVSVAQPDNAKSDTDARASKSCNQLKNLLRYTQNQVLRAREDLALSQVTDIERGARNPSLGFRQSAETAQAGARVENLDGRARELESEYNNRCR